MTMQVKVTAERLKRKYAERKRGQKDAMSYLCDTNHQIKNRMRWCKSRSQNPN